MTEAYDDAGFVMSSRYRVAVMERLDETPAIPSDIASDTLGRDQITHISRSLSELRDRDLVELLVAEERTKGRIYGLTDHGEETLEKYEELSQ